MNWTKFLLASLAGAVANFLLGWIFYGMLLEGMMKDAMTPEAQAVNKEQPILAGIFISCLLTAMLLAYIFEGLAGIRKAGKGLIAGLIMGILISASLDVSWLSMLNMFNNHTYVFIDIAVNGVMMGLTGAVIAGVLGIGRQPLPPTNA